jgi:hypothetical protein
MDPHVPIPCAWAPGKWKVKLRSIPGIHDMGCFKVQANGCFKRTGLSKFKRTGLSEQLCLIPVKVLPRALQGMRQGLIEQDKNYLQVGFVSLRVVQVVVVLKGFWGVREDVTPTAHRY